MTAPPVDTRRLFGGDGEMARRGMAFDWAGTTIGAVETWSPGLCHTVALLMRSPFSMCLSWGPDLVLLYNDAFIPTLGAKHPAALGAEIQTVFPEIWHEVGHLQRSVLEGGEAVFAEDVPLLLERGDGPEEMHYTFSYSHVPEDITTDRGPGGVLTVVTDTTRAIVGARRMRLLNVLSGAVNTLDDQAQAVAASLAVLADHASDLHHGACYLPGPSGGLELAATFGPGPDWPSSTTAGSQDVVQQVLLEGRPVIEHLPPSSDGPRVRLALPLVPGSPADGVLLVAPHALRPWDEEHERFLHLMAEQVGQLVTLAAARADEHRRLASLAAADAAKSTFLANVSHEFRTPLTLLLSPLQDALSHGVDTLGPDELRSMHQSAHRLLWMVNTLLEVSRAGADPEPTTWLPTDVAQLTTELLGPFGAVAERAGLRFDLTVRGEAGLVHVDRGAWETIVLNLAANALKYTLSGGIEVSLDQHDGEIDLRVRDTGVGIPVEEQPRVFDRFHRVAGPPGRTIEGTGLGLALVADAVRVLGGEVAVTSTPDVGSTFTVRVRLARLPEVAGDRLAVAAGSGQSGRAGEYGAAAALAQHVTPIEHDAPDDGTSPRRAGSTSSPDRVILVADDNPDMRRLLARSLVQLGSVTACADGAEALEVLRRGPVDLVLTDVMMPRLDGIELLRAIRGDDTLAHVPVVLLSARASTEAAMQALVNGADDYIIKPFVREELLARCRTTIELASLRASRSAEAARTTMLAGVSHDMQTPLSVIAAVLEMLADPDLDAAERCDLVRRGTARAAHLEQLVSQFLDWARLAAGVTITARSERTDLGELVGRVTRLHPGTRPSGSTALEVTCDRTRTERILHNLLDNAHAAARESVCIEVVQRGTQVEVHVTDDGPGVAPQVLPRLFTAFSPTASPSGSGLGLHVSRASARAQGGDLTLASTGSAGSRFVLHLRTST